MQRDELVKRVQEMGELGSREEAEQAIEATFETLKKRLAGNDPDNLASQLPEGLADPLQGEGGWQDFSIGEFYERVAQRGGVEADQATRHAQAVALVLQEAVTTGEVDHVRDQLKEEYAELFGRKGE